jgi:hypothetical protein
LYYVAVTPYDNTSSLPSTIEFGITCLSDNCVFVPFFFFFFFLNRNLLVSANGCARKFLGAQPAQLEILPTSRS